MRESGKIASHFSFLSLIPVKVVEPMTVHIHQGIMDNDGIIT